MINNRQCVVLVPVARHIEPECERSLQQLEAQGYPVWRVWGFSDISRGRSQIITDALAAGFEEFMWIDSDIAFDPTSIDRLRSHDLPVVGGIYPAKGQRRLTCVPASGTEAIQFGEKGGLMEVAALGGGFVLVRRRVMETVQSVCQLPLCGSSTSANGIIPYYQPLIAQAPSEVRPSLLGEDISFCERVRRSGFKIFADTTIRLYHIGRYFFSWEDAGSDVKRYNNYTFHLNGQK